MSPDMVVQRLRQLRYGRPPSLDSIRRQAGVSRTELYRGMNRGTFSEAKAKALAAVLQDIPDMPYQNRRSPRANSGRL